jgi:hypothetical protein
MAQCNVLHFSTRSKRAKENCVCLWVLLEIDTGKTRPALPGAPRQHKETAKLREKQKNGVAEKGGKKVEQERALF